MVPLVKIEGDEIVIRVPIDATPFAAGYAMLRAWGQEYPVTDARVFAAELVRELRKEEEDGTTLVHTMLDKAVLNAVENGAEGVSLEPLQVQP